jgi:hypothetical protein
LRGIIGDDGENEVGGGSDFGERGAGFGAEFGGEGLRAGRVDVVNGGDAVVLVFEAAGHVGAHAADSDEGNG